MQPEGENDTCATILVVEDDADSRELICAILEEEGFRVVPAATGEEALRAAEGALPGLILLDLMLPDSNGVEVCRRLKEGPAANVPVVIVTARNETGQKVSGLEAGADDYITKPFENAEFIARIKARLRIRELESENEDARLALEKANRQLRRYIDELQESYVGTVASLSAAIEAKDPSTEGHSRRVIQYALRIGLKLGLGPEQIRDLRYAAQLHDLGKIGIPLSLLEKRSKLDARELQALHRHAEISASILEPIGFLRKVVPIIRHHHEFLDGQGYPDALSGEGIPIESRIIAVADAYDAMTSSRPYRDAMSRQDAVAQIRAGTGKQFDQRVVAVLLEVLEEEGKNTEHRTPNKEL